MGVGSQRRGSAALPLEKDQVHTVQEARWVPGLVKTGEEKVAPTGIRFSGLRAHKESLYRLR